MEHQENTPARHDDEMNKRREKMADGRRYIIYYTFGKEAPHPPDERGREPEKDVRT